ncbi:hypothetical protein D3C86_1860730 [compost metagenome]
MFKQLTAGQVDKFLLNLVTVFRKIINQANQLGADHRDYCKQDQRYDTGDKQKENDYAVRASDLAPFLHPVNQRIQQIVGNSRQQQRCGHGMQQD